MYTDAATVTKPLEYVAVEACRPSPANCTKKLNPVPSGRPSNCPKQVSEDLGPLCQIPSPVSGEPLERRILAFPKV